MKARDNPFGATRVLSEIRYVDPTDGVPDAGSGVVALLPRLAALGYRAAIVGPHGSGKTTLLEDLEQVLAQRGFRITHVRLDTEDRRLPRDWRLIAGRLGAGDIVCLDGAEQLGPVAWRWFGWCARRAGGLIITAHRPGHLPTLVACTTNAGLLDRIVRRLAPDAADGMPGAVDLFARHRGNLRDALREMYDVYAGLSGPRDELPHRLVSSSTERRRDTRRTARA